MMDPDRSNRVANRAALASQADPANEDRRELLVPEEISAIRARRSVQVRPVDGDHPFVNKDAVSTPSNQVDLSLADWSGEKFAGASLCEANLSVGTYTSADFSGCNLRGAKLDRSTFEGADFRDADLWNVSLRDADLSRAENLTPAQFAGADLTRAKVPDEMKEFEGLAAVDGLSASSSKVFIALMLGAIYTFLTIGTTRDIHFLTPTTAPKLPLLGIDIPVVEFCVVTPVILLAVFVYFHFYLQRLWEVVSNLPAFFPDGRRLDEKTHPWLMNDLVRQYFPRLARQAPPLARPQAFLSLFLGYWLIPLSLLTLWIFTLRLQDLAITLWQSIVLSCCIGFSALFSSLASKTLGKNQAESFVFMKFPRSIGRGFGLPAGLVCFVTLCALYFLCFSASAITKRRDVMYDREEKASNGAPELDPIIKVRLAASEGYISRIFSRADYLDVSRQELTPRPPSWSGKSKDLDEDLTKVKRILFRKKNLIKLVAKDTFLPRTEFSEADVSHAVFDGADLRDSIFVLSIGKSATFAGATLGGKEEVPLSSGDSKNDLVAMRAAQEGFRGAKFDGGSFASADFHEAAMSGVSFRFTDLVGADFRRTSIRNAYFSDLDLSRGNFAEAMAGSSRFTKVTFRGKPDLEGIFDNCDLSRCRFVGCRFVNLSFHQTIMTAVQFENCEFENVTFEDLSLSSVKFYQCKGLRSAVMFINAALPPENVIDSE